MSRGEAGMALIEVLAATVILAAAGVGLAESAAVAVRAVADATARERALADEERLMAAYALLGGTDLDRRLGQTRVGSYVVTVARPERALYRIAIGPGADTALEDLVTVVFRPDSSDAH